MQGFKLKRVIWALDPLEKGPDSKQALTAVLQQFASLDKTETQPVYVSKPERRIFVSLEKVAEAQLGRITKASQIPGILPPKILKTDSRKNEDAVKVLIEYAVDSKSDLIVTQTHGHSGIRRLFLGSFAETLLLRSPIPVLVMNPHVVPAHKFQRILFPTRFNRHSVRLFREIVEFAKLMNSRIILFHAVLTPLSPYSGGSIFYARELDSIAAEYTRKEKDKAERRTKVWTAYASKQGVTLEFVLEIDQHFIFEAILSAAQKYKARLIALETETGPTVFGGVTRNLARYSDCPVLVLRSQHASRSLMERAA